MITKEGTAYYRFGGVDFYQSELLYDEYAVCRTILREKVKLFEMSHETMGQVLDQLYEQGLLIELINYILRERKSVRNIVLNPFKRILRRYNPKNKAGLLTAQQLAQVIADFFALNVGWTTNLLVLPKELDMTLMQKQAEKGLSQLMRFITLFQKEISDSTNQSVH
jgi:hypothetical protein